jgi:hypothetical protein
MTHDNHNPLAATAKLTKATPDQATANAIPLMPWTHGHRSKRNRRQSSLRDFDCHSAEQDMANNLTLNLGYERKQDDSFFPQSVNQIGLVGPLESGLVDAPNFEVICWPLRPDLKTRLRLHGAFLHRRGGRVNAAMRRSAVQGATYKWRQGTPGDVAHPRFRRQKRPPCYNFVVFLY